MKRRRKNGVEWVAGLWLVVEGAVWWCGGHSGTMLTSKQPEEKGRRQRWSVMVGIEVTSRGISAKVSEWLITWQALPLVAEFQAYMLHSWLTGFLTNRLACWFGSQLHGGLTGWQGSWQAQRLAGYLCGWVVGCRCIHYSSSVSDDVGQA